MTLFDAWIAPVLTWIAALAGHLWTRATAAPWWFWLIVLPATVFFVTVVARSRRAARHP